MNTLPHLFRTSITVLSVTVLFTAPGTAAADENSRAASTITTAQKSASSKIVTGSTGQVTTSDSLQRLLVTAPLIISEEETPVNGTTISLTANSTAPTKVPSPTSSDSFPVTASFIGETTNNPLAQNEGPEETGSKKNDDTKNDKPTKTIRDKINDGLKYVLAGVGVLGVLWGVMTAINMYLPQVEATIPFDEVALTDALNARGVPLAGGFAGAARINPVLRPVIRAMAGLQ